MYPGVAVSNLTGNGSVSGADLQSYIGRLSTRNITNFGGLMLWDGSFALVEDSDGINFLTYAKGSVLNLLNAVRSSYRDTMGSK